MQRLSQEDGISLAGIQRILELEHEVSRLEERVEVLTAELERARLERSAAARVFAAGRAGDVVAVRAGERPSRTLSDSRALVVWRPRA